MCRRTDLLGTAAPIRIRRGRPLAKLDVVRQVLEVYDLTGRSVGQTARICRVHHRTVRKIVEGAHPNYLTAAQLAPGERFLSPPELCGRCGAPKVVDPCRTCRARDGMNDLRRLEKLAAEARASAAKNPRRRRKDVPGQRLLPLQTVDGPYELTDLKLGFNLRRKHRRRLEQVRARRRRYGIPLEEEVPF